MSDNPRIAGLSQVNARTLGIRWSDGVTTEHDVRELRLACTCATCVHEWTGEALLVASNVPEDVRPGNIEGVGLYGIRIDWSDGHSTGIYTYERLRQLAGLGGDQQQSSGAES